MQSFAIDYYNDLNCSKNWKARSIFVEKGFSVKDDGIALENIYYEAAPPSPQGILIVIIIMTSS